MGEKEKEKEKNMPTGKFRVGTMCLTEWTNKSKEGDEFKNYTIQASYFDKEKEKFVETDSVSKVQLMNLRTCIDEALKVDVKNE